jgi:hypothetical protein
MFNKGMSKSISTDCSNSKTLSGKSGCTIDLNGPDIEGILPLSKGGTGSSTLTGITGTGNIVASNSPSLTTPNIGAATGSSLTLTSLPSANFLYTNGSGALVKGVSPKFRASLGANQLIGPGLTVVNIDTVDFDTTSAFNTTTYTFQPTVAGYYQFSATLGPAFPTVAGFIEVSLWRDGTGLTLFAAQGFHSQNTPDRDAHQNCSGLIYMNGTTHVVKMYVSATIGQTLPAGGSFISGTLVA